MSGAPYNGYDGRQRARIIPAFRRVAGQRTPFPDEPCAMCCDPDRAVNEWHSEDYSEPFSFKPPQSYPLCKACHSRLHKRFNAPHGDWELFCLHLESGGYGSEYVKRWALSERQTLALKLSSELGVVLGKVRERQLVPHWWRELTLDPESLNAPWARPRPLRPRPEQDAFADSFRKLSLSKLELAILRAHVAAPRRTVSMRAIASDVLGSSRPQSANLIYGKLAGRIATELGWPMDKRPDGSAIGMSVLAEGWQPPAREYEWTMVPTAAAAVDAFSI